MDKRKNTAHLYRALIRTIALEFYRINTGFFLVSCVLLFGLTNGRATIDMHHFIMQQITSSPWGLVAGIVVWLAYGGKCALYALRALRQPHNQFLYTMQAISNRLQWIALLGCFGLMLAPLLLYGLIAVVVGMAHGTYLLALLFLCFLAVLGPAGAWLMAREINTSFEPANWQSVQLPATRRRPYYSLLLYHSLAERKSTFIGIKALSLLLLQVLVAVNRYQVNRESVSVLMMFLIAAHALLPYYYQAFSEQQLAYTRNMPIPLCKRYLQYAFTYAILFLPELGFLLVNRGNAMSIPFILSLYAAGISQLLFYTGLLYLPAMHTQRYILAVFTLFFASLLFLASFNTWPLFATGVLASIVLLRSFYYRYDPPLPE